MATQEVVQALKEQFKELGLEARPLCVYVDGRDAGQLWTAVPADRLVEVATFLRDDERCAMEQLCDVTCVDYLHHPEPLGSGRFGVTYALLSLSRNHRLWLKVFVDDPEPTVPSLTSVWKGAEWPEREVFDLFGIRFRNHPDLRRILMPDGFVDHPLRKDYPLTGKGERERFEVLTRDSR